MGPGETIQPALRIALAWQPAHTRQAWETVFAFDAHLARVVSQAREGVLAQVRLAWWRDRLGEPPNARPAGNLLLAALGEHLAGMEAELIALVDGWEELLGEHPLSERALAAFADGRAVAFGAAARKGQAVSGGAESASKAGRRWALADFACHTRDEAEREKAFAVAVSTEPAGLMPRQLRGIAVLGALADRAIARREPVLAGRAAPLVALRVGLTGR
ncbi:hypothetical protein [Tsuneonella sp. SYSU-LHT278]|uniref:hypothetical protein n=1 Tax=Tsuneonella sediminis TaxID=3416089 RepID=UPI003F7961C4